MSNTDQETVIFARVLTNERKIYIVSWEDLKSK